MRRRRTERENKRESCIVHTITVGWVWRDVGGWVGGWVYMQKSGRARERDPESFSSMAQQKNNSVLNVKKPLAPKELIFVCRFRLFNVQRLANIKY